MKKIIGIIVIVLLIPIIIYVIRDIDRTPIYPTTEFNIEEKLTRISSIDIENGIQLPKMPNGVGDRRLSDGRIERNVGRAVFDGSENWTRFKFGDEENYTSICFRLVYSFPIPSLSGYNHYMSNIFISGWVNPDNVNIMEIQRNYIFVRLSKSDLVEYGYDDSMTDQQKANVFKSWLSQNNLEVYYQLAEPITENAPIFSEYIDFYDGGSVIVDDGLIDYTVVGNQAQINYIEGNITTAVDGQFEISKPTKIISKSNDLYDYDLSNLPSYIEYGSLPQGTYNNVIEFNNNNQNKQTKLFFDDNIQDSRYNVYLENNTIIINNDTEVIRIYDDDTYTSTRNLDTNITYKLEGYHILDYIDGKFDNRVLAFFWIIPVLLAGGLIYLLLKRKE